MGVPKFYRWISERYPCLSEVLKEYQLPEFDNLYLDMNGIIHTCSHPEDNNPHFRITEEKIFADVFHYIEVLFRMIKPKKVFFMAIDGVAPRAKMNQQRGRRFRSAREAEELEKQAVAKGEILPKEQRFDSNCITPGTEFMAKLHEQLKYFVSKKVSTDKLWQGPRIYLSGHETPGEGEHKIMDFIRAEKSHDNYDPNTRHCLYGLDADLIMLGLATHEPHFSLLREEVKFTGKNAQKRSVAPEETTFHLLHLSLMREYLDFEFGDDLRSKLPFQYSVENIIDDWVLMGFLVGNDFIPHLPHIHIHQDCLPLLWQTYKNILPTLDGYLNENGLLNLPRFEKYLISLAQYDIEKFQEKFEDLKWAAGKRKQLLENAMLPASKTKMFVSSSLTSDVVGIPTANDFMLHKFEFDSPTDDLELEPFNPDFGADENGKDGEEEDEEDDDDDDDDDEDSCDGDVHFNTEFRKFKANYYTDKMDFARVTTEVLQSQAYGYVQAIQWILHYYYNGVPSWSWFYPHHYAPYLSDVKGFSNLKIEFELGTPFMPFEQLMAVLPTASRSLLPEALQGLMVSDTSPVKDYYPVNFETDLNGKLQEWEAVVLIPFIDEKRLLHAMEPCIERMRPDEKARNIHGPHLLYQYTSDSLGTYPSPLPSKFPDLVHNYAKLTEIPKDGFVIPIEKQRKGICSGVRLDVFFPGFPTLKHLPHKASLKKAGVKVFQMNSRNDNMILELTDRPQIELDKAARDLIGRTVFIGWPHLIEAIVEAVATDEHRFCSSEMPPKERSPTAEAVMYGEPLNMDAQSIWHKEAESIHEWYFNRRGVEIGETNILVYARQISGRRYVCGQQGLVTLEKQWQNRATPYAHQIVVKDIAVQDHSFTQFKTLDNLFPAKASVFLLGKPHYGALGEVLDIDVKEGRVRASYRILVEPSLNNVKHQFARESQRYFPAYSLAQKLGISSHLLSRITGTVYVVKGDRSSQNAPRVNAGLNLKFNKTNKEVPGFTRKVEREWSYSFKVVDILREYMQKFPEVFDCINRVGSQNDLFYEDDVFGDKKSERLPELVSFLKNVPCAKVDPSAAGTVIVDETVVELIEQEVAKAHDINNKKRKHLKMQVRPHLLYQPLEAQVNSIPDPLTDYELFDRVVNVREGYSVPLGLRGTVIGISPGEKEQDALYEVLFDEEFLGGLVIRCSPNRAYRMPSSALINITFGEERREHVAQQQKTQHSFDSPRSAHHYQQHQQMRRPVNGEKLKQSPQQQQPPVFKILQHPRQSENSPGRQVADHSHSPLSKQQNQECSQELAKPGGPNFGMVWSQLQQKPVNAASDTEVGNATVAANATMPPAPFINGQVLCPPSAWLKNSSSETEAQKSDDASKQSKDVEQVLSELFKSATLQDHRQLVIDKTPTQAADKAPAYKRQLTVEELFKSVEECQHWVPSDADKKPSTDDLSRVMLGLSLDSSASVESVDKLEGVDERGVRTSSSTISEIPSSGSLNQPGYGALGGVPIRPTQVEPYSPDSRSVSRQTSAQPSKSASRHHNPNQHLPPSLLRAPIQPPQPKGRNAQNLLLFCQARGLMPKYECQWNNGQCQSYVTIGNRTFSGSMARSYEQATDSAAGAALYNLQNMGHGGGLQQGPRSYFPPSAMPPHFSASANSAFTPVQSRFMRPGGMYGGMAPVSRGQLAQPPPVWFQHNMYMQPSNHHPPPARPLAPLSRESHDAQAAAQRPSSHNEQLETQFVPTQVMRRQKTPHKDTKPADSAPTSTAVPTTTTTSIETTPKSQRNLMSSFNEQTTVSPQTKQTTPSSTSLSNDIAASPSTPASSEGKHPTRKSRSRIAANFGALNQS